MEEYVVLVNEKNEVVGTQEKMSAHSAQTPLHRGISVFLFDKKGNFLLQQRSNKKKTWPLVWSNSCCGHPKLNETSIDTAKRRLAYELGITDAKITVVLPDYRYRFTIQGVWENEFCPVMVGFTDQKPTINTDEVEAVKWITWKEWLSEVQKNPDKYSQWCIEETNLLTKNKSFRDLLEQVDKKSIF